MKKKILQFIYFSLAGSARKVINKHHPFVIAVTGSVGKSSTKEAIYKVLVDHFGKEAVWCNQGNLNAEIGIPLTILGYKVVPSKLLWPVFLIAARLRAARLTNSEYPKYLVIEMGVEHKGDIEYFGTIIKPDIAVITSIGGAHLKNFASLKEYQDEKLRILSMIKDEDNGIINIDDPDLAKVTGNYTTISVENKKATYFVENPMITLDGTEYRISKTGQKIAVKSQIFGKHLIYSQLIAFAVGQKLNIRPLDAAKSLEKITPYPGRMNLVEGKNGIKIIDDTYNSNPTSARAALDTLASINYRSRKVAILGNMNELGEIEKTAHRQIGEYAKGKADVAIFVGPNAENMAKGYGQGALTMRDRFEVIKKLPELLEANDLILIKASQGNNFFEEITKSLMKDPSKADKMLVRQSSYWLSKKKR